MKIIPVYSDVIGIGIKRHGRYKLPKNVNDYHHLPAGRYIITDINYQRKQYKLIKTMNSMDGYFRNITDYDQKYEYWVSFSEIDKDEIIKTNEIIERI